MDGGDLVKLLALGALLACSAFFSSTEAALFSLGRVRIHSLFARQPARAAVIRDLLAHPDQLLITVLIGNEVVNIGTAVVVASFWEGVLGLGYGFWTITFISTATSLPLLLLFGEIVPKTIAVKRSEEVSLLVARPIQAFARLVTPIRWVLRRVASLLTRPFGPGPSAAQKAFSERDFRTLVDLGKKEGVIEEQEHAWIHNVFEFDDRPVLRIMTPRSRIFALPLDLPAAEILDRVREAGYSRIPIYEETLDRVVGILYAKDLLPFARGGDPSRMPPLRGLLRTPVYIEDRASAAHLFRELRARRTHLALVVDERGLVRGLVTMEDLLEELFGEIADERDRDEALEGRRPLRSVSARPPSSRQRGGGG
jgi:putative hemolysin